MSRPIIIKHRNRRNGPGKDDNYPASILISICEGHNVEIDVWLINNEFYLGHDAPSFKIDEKFLENHLLWCHAKNSEALFKMLDNPNIHCFWHDNDKHTITSNGFIWQAHYDDLTDKTVVVDLSPNPNFNANCYALCLDFVPK